MRILITSDYDAVSEAGATLIAAAIRRTPGVRLGTATGATPVGCYERLVRLHREAGLDFQDVVLFMLDEYIGLPPTDPQSYHAYMRRHLAERVNLSPKRLHLHDGTPRDDWEVYARHYERAIRDEGGIDVQLLGIGENGHIGFNEPTSSLASRTRPVVLTADTRRDNQSAFGPQREVPRCAITMGIGTILEARHLILLASGSAKASAIRRAVEGPISACVTASALQLHPHVTVVVDEAAAAQLSQREYYREAEAILPHGPSTLL
jgi:glucosamine-6-phosphate deaminase